MVVGARNEIKRGGVRCEKKQNLNTSPWKKYTVGFRVKEGGKKWIKKEERQVRPDLP